MKVEQNLAHREDETNLNKDNEHIGRLSGTLIK